MYNVVCCMCKTGVPKNEVFYDKTCQEWFCKDRKACDKRKKTRGFQRKPS